MGGDLNRTKLCPNCVSYVGDQDASCRHCGYRFDSGDVPATATWGTGAPTTGATVSGGEGGSPVTVQVQNDQAVHTIDVSQQMQTAQRAGKWIALVVGLIILAGIAIPVFTVVRGVNSAVDEFSDFEVPGVTIPTIDITPFEIDIAQGTGSFRACRSAAMKWLRELLANDGAGSRSLSELFIEASEDVGAVSDDYGVIVQAFSGSQGTAIQKGTRAGLRQAKGLVTEGCRDAYP